VFEHLQGYLETNPPNAAGKKVSSDEWRAYSKTPELGDEPGIRKRDVKRTSYKCRADFNINRS
jgi:hypothetical protein